MAALVAYPPVFISVFKKYVLYKFVPRLNSKDMSLQVYKQLQLQLLIMN